MFLSCLQYVQPHHRPNEGRDIWNNNLTCIDNALNAAYTAATITGNTILVSGNNINLTGPGASGSPPSYTVSLYDDISLTSIKTGSISGDTFYSGTTDISNVFMPIDYTPPTGVTGGGVSQYLALWNSSTAITSSNILYDGASLFSVSGDLSISGNLEVLGTATTINTQDLAVQDNNIILNSGGTHLSSIGGGFVIEDGVSNGSDSTWTIDNIGNWSANTAIKTQGLEVQSGSIISGTTDIYDIFLEKGEKTNVQSGSNVITGGTEFSPTISLSSNISVNKLSVSATTEAALNLPVLPLSFTSSIHGDTWISGDSPTGTLMINIVVSGITRSVELT